MQMNQIAGDGPEDGSDPRRSPPLQGEQRQDDHESDGHHQVLGAGVATLSPSTALSTEMAGVMIPSP